MLLRNYDNYMIARKIPYTTSNDYTVGDASIFGDGHLNFKNYQGAIKQFISNSFTNNSGRFMAPFTSLLENKYASGCCNLIVGSDDTEVTYDDYKLGEIISSSQIKAVNHEVTAPVYNQETNSWDVTYTKRYMAISDITIKELGITELLWTSGGAGITLLYREVLPSPIEVLTDSVVVLNFTTKFYADINKPTDYVATASVE